MEDQGVAGTDGVLLDFLEFIVQGVKVIAGDGPDGVTLEEFVLDHGRFFTPAPLPPDVDRMEMGACFGNAYEVAINKRLRYVEGFAFMEGMVFPVLHAWCVDGDGCVVDPTWAEGLEYFGLPLRMSYVSWIVDFRGDKAFSVLNNKEMEHPLLTGHHLVEHVILEGVGHRHAAEMQRRRSALDERIAQARQAFGTSGMAAVEA